MVSQRTLSSWMKMWVLNILITYLSSPNPNLVSWRTTTTKYLTVLKILSAWAMAGLMISGAFSLHYKQTWAFSLHGFLSHAWFSLSSFSATFSALAPLVGPFWGQGATDLSPQWSQELGLPHSSLHTSQLSKLCSQGDCMFSNKNSTKRSCPKK